MTNFKMLAKTFFELEETLADELRKLNAQDVKIGIKSVSFYYK
jgi:putative N6-adenine-specific DNA methylase